LTEKRNLLLVINPAAGKSSWEKRLLKLENMLQEAGLRYERFFTEKNGRGKLAGTLDNDPSFTDLLVFGGDGTLNYVVNEMAGRQLPISIVSNGTGNDSVKSLHGILDFDKQADIAIQGKISKFDLGICNGRYFVNGFGIGFDGQVVKEMLGRKRKKGGHLDYLLTVLRIIWGFKEKKLLFSIDEVEFEKNILLLTVSNGTTFGGGFVINPNAIANDGWLDLCLLKEIPPVMRFWHLPKLKKGVHHKIKAAEFFKAKKVRIAASNELVAHLDGEEIGCPPFDISIIKEGLLLRTPE
jgi:YegS/Rv2252/BmrU family lipid kinase